MRTCHLHSAIGLCCLLAVASSPSSRLRDAVPGFSYEDGPFASQVLPALPSVERSLATVETRQLVDECRRVVAEGASLRERYRTMNRVDPAYQSTVDAAYRLPWIICLVAVRRIADSAEYRWLDALDEFAGSWERSVPGGWHRMHGVRSVQLVLMEETVTAAVKLMRADQMPPGELARRYRDLHVERQFTTARSRAIGRVFYAYLYGEASWAPEIVALFSDPHPDVRIYMGASVPTHTIPAAARDAAVGLLADPDPRVRESVARKYANLRPDLGHEMVPALLRFLARDDIDQDAREAAERGIRGRGYLTASVEDGLIAVPIRESLLPRHMNEDLNEK
jgi:hypothetical protein